MDLLYFWRTILEFMIAEAKNVISVTYELRENSVSGTVIEQTTKDHPFVFIFGAGGLLEEFENNLKGLKHGDGFEFTIEHVKAYGEVDQNAIVELPISLFMIEGKLSEDLLFVGNTITMRDKDGHPLQGTILHVSNEQVKMDFNHPLAGKNLHFKGNIENIRQATAEELDHGHVHGNGGVHHH